MGRVLTYLGEVMDIIELAKQAGFFVADNEVYSPSNQADHELTGFVESFANLVEAAARADEREECAKLAATPVGTIASAIRARGTT